MGSLRTVSVVGFALMVAAIAILVLRRELFSPSPVAIGLQISAFALMVWARIAFGRRSFHAAADATAGGLVTSGPYAMIRHPIYAAVCLFCWAGILARPTAISVLVGAVLVGGALLRLAAEERLILQRYPAYADYARTTKRMVPWVW